MTEHRAWDDPTKPPFGRKLVKVNDRMWTCWQRGDTSPHVWHWCDRSVRNAALRAEGVTPQDAEPGWSLAGTDAHDLVSKDPITLSPSLALPDCCGLHGYLEDGVWRDV